MHYLLLARFSMDDIPLRLYGNRAMAEDAAKAIDADPGLLKTKWQRSLASWPHGVSGGFVGMIVLSISDSDGYPGQVTFDSTDYVPPDETAPPAKTTPPEPGHPPVPEGHIEITDPEHRLRSEIDYALDLADTKDGWSKVQKATVGDNSHKFRFCCPADKHPDLQPAPAPDPNGPSLATANGTTLASAARSLDAENADLRRRVVDLEAQVWSLTNERVSLSSKSEELQRRNVAYSRTNDELRALNEDLNHRLNATQARASRATELEGSLRGTAQHLLVHFQELEERTKWSLRFADEGLLPAAYCKAMQHCQRRFAEEFEGFLRKYPHVLLDIPEEYRPYDDSDDEMND